MTSEMPSSDSPPKADGRGPHGAAGVLHTLHRLLLDPTNLVPAMSGQPARQAGLLALSLLGFAVYGAAAGLFQGGSQVAVAALKAPVIVLASWLICLPSLYVFTTLAGTDYSRGDLVSMVVSGCGIQALLLLALLPISWLFTVSSRSLLFVVLLHASVWLVALFFARRLFARVLRRPLVGPLLVWSLLLAVVSLQMTTFIRPVLWRAAGQPLFCAEKLFFVEHLVEAGRISHDVSD